MVSTAGRSRARVDSAEERVTERSRGRVVLRLRLRALALWPGAVAAVGVLAITLLAVRETDAPFLGTLLVDATSSVLSPSGFSRVLDLVGQAGKAFSLAGTIILLFFIYLRAWDWGTGRLEPDASFRERLPIAAIQVIGLFSTVVILTAALDLLAASSVLGPGEWGEYLWETLVFAAGFVILSHGLQITAHANWVAEPAEGPAWLARDESRRGFLFLAAGAASVAGAFYLGRSVVRATRTGVRQTFAGMLPPPVTPNDAFYTVSKNFFDPTVDGESWRLRVDGMVETPLALTLDEVRQFPAAESMNTLMCISYELGDELISNARWVGTSLINILDAAGVEDGATHLMFTGADDYTESHSLNYVQDPRVRAVWEMNGEPLPDSHGFPLRLLAPGRYGIKNPKWITRITLLDHDVEGFWQQRGWSQDGLINTMSRIDVPGRGRRTTAGQTRVEGIAFAGERGISRVEVSVDGGDSWADADLDPEFGPLAWRFWRFRFSAEPQSYQIFVRATDGGGATQTSEVRPTLPDGATGYHSRSLRGNHAHRGPVGRGR